ncbi:hypothetical protein CFC21_033909 [Triticum aestivum]|uniref:NB-ARC domain-containing protein n=2 Tax=Triticum aestivum TaxID=4565 RepID=A0A9R1JKV4_WHEAT|nr:uncharacterized protein LOC123057798 [Triticum aestivum]KAF7020857.1 hypothetical protein CFC21_033909 [Triticum aestivum]
MPNMKFLKIDGAHAVTKVGSEFVGYKKGEPICNELVAFLKLEWLFISNMPKWEEWSFFEEEIEVTSDERREDGAVESQKENAQSVRLRLLPRLEQLGLDNCPKLRALPQQLGEHTTSLKKLYLDETNSLKAVENLPHLTELLHITKCGKLERICNLPQLTELRVHGCPNLIHVEGLESLQRLWLGEDMQVVSSRWLAVLQKQHRRLHGEDLDVYTWSTS